MMSERPSLLRPMAATATQQPSNKTFILNGYGDNHQLESERLFAFHSFDSDEHSNLKASFTTGVTFQSFADGGANSSNSSPPISGASATISSCDELRYFSRDALQPMNAGQLVHSKSIQRMSYVGTDRDYVLSQNRISNHKKSADAIHIIYNNNPVENHVVSSAYPTCNIGLYAGKPSQLPLPSTSYRRQFTRRNGVINTSNKPVEATFMSPPASSAHDDTSQYNTKTGELLMRRSFNKHRKRDYVNVQALSNCSTTPPTPSTGATGAPSMLNALAVASSQQHLIPQRPLRRCRSASPAPIRPPLLNAEQQNLIKKSWQRVSKTSVGRSIIQYMSEKCKDLSALFRDDTAGVHRHERYFVDLIQSALDNLDDMDTALRDWLETIGNGHRGFAIKNKHWDVFGEAMTCVLTNWVGPGKSHRETVRAWRILFSYISDRLSASSRRCIASSMTSSAGTLSDSIVPPDSSGNSTPSSHSASCCNIPRIQLMSLVSNGPLTPP